MRKLLTILILFVSNMAIAQITQPVQSYILTKEQHDLLRKNIEDYKVLIQKFDLLNMDFEKMKREYEIIKAQKNNQSVEFRQLELDLSAAQLRANNMQIKFDNLKLSYDDLQKKILTMDKQLEHTGRSVSYWQQKYKKEIRYDRGDRIMAGAVFGTLVGGALMAIYIAIEDHWHVHK